jgi:hypothetical protein
MTATVLRFASRKPSVGSPLERLSATRNAVEGKFLEAGDVLAKTVEGVGGLVSTLDALIAALDPEMVADTTHGLTHSADTLLRLPEGRAARRGQIEGLLKSHRGLDEKVGEMHRILAYLRIFAVNIRITAASIPAAHLEFASFSDEIASCIEGAARELDAFGRELRVLGDDLEQASVRQRQLAKLHARMLPAVPNALHDDATTLGAERHRFSELATSVAALAREVQSKTAKALTALQVGDSCRQRIEHVESGLALLEEVCAQLDPAAAAEVRGALAKLLAELLRAGAHDFRVDTTRISDNIVGLARDARSIARLGELAAGKTSERDGGALRSLEADVGRALELVKEMEESEREASTLAESAAGMARALSSRISGIQSMRKDVQQMALNAALKSNRIGDAAKPLSVIAAQLRQYGSELESSGVAALELVAQLGVQADSLAASATGTAADGEIASGLSTAVEKIGQASAAIERQIATASGAGTTVIEILDRAARRLDLQSSIGDVLEEVAGAVDAGAASGPVRADSARAALADAFDRIATSYTMVQEREVHRRVTSALGLDVAVTDAPAAGSDDDALF